MSQKSIQDIDTVNDATSEKKTGGDKKGNFFGGNLGGNKQSFEIFR